LSDEAQGKGSFNKDRHEAYSGKGSGMNQVPRFHMDTIPMTFGKNHALCMPIPLFIIYLFIAQRE
jgi:hypothetical protein